jgi:phosphatidate cytidylyltransferase
MPCANSAAATAGTVPALSDTGLRVRLASALILIPVALVAVALGAPYFDALVVVAAGLMAWEWARLCSGGRLPAAGALAILVVVAATVAVSFLPVWQATCIVAVGAALVGALAALTGGAPLWLALGTLYAGLPCVAILWLRAEPAAGLETLLWLFALVWAIDSGAYVVGRAVGGPKLAPVISPKKTWAGLAGGVAAAMAVGILAGLLIDGASPWVLAAAGLVLALVEQAGDLGESALKRRFGAKDSSGLIPGHGGVLDRVDGLVTVILAVALASALTGESVVAWR